MTFEARKILLQKAARAAKEHLPKGWGLCLIIAPVNSPIYQGGEFVSDLRKQDCIHLIRDTANRLERNLLRSQ